ncbi:PHA-granule associated protein 4 [Cupriavidus pinatubonensis]|uniref:PHA-granule associated protein 4 n=1 Tax=Cupriavidus pinatubonensis TaxID=248026 RepID=A0ABN7ZNE3_9BURK|nr:PHA-granule associated protein 4 [Cupriavidus pinatubonensis]CAG9187457.1 hypothetical protein LMG23994_06902 [Cupriavidus pinatubonensis]
MTIFVAHNRASALEHINLRRGGTVDLDYETAWQDALELGRLGEACGVSVQFRTIEYVAVRSPDALICGLRADKLTFRQRHLYCLFDLMELPEACLDELEARAVQHGDYILAGHLLRETTLIWE